MENNEAATSESREQHWNNIFNTRDYTQVFWHQESPSVSFDFINEHAKIDSSIIDIGCGASFLVEKLIEKGYKDINLLDTSRVSLDIVKKRLGENANIPNCICADITNFKSDKKFDIWHDRAVLHFLLIKEDREKYFKALSDSINSDGVAIISTFATGGDISCAGLPIMQYDYKIMEEELPPELKIVKYNEFLHKTPKDTSQEYCSFVIKKA